MVKKTQLLQTIFRRGFMSVRTPVIRSLIALKDRWVGAFEWGAFAEEMSGYWKIYGGLKAVITSPWLILSIFVTFGCYPIVESGGWIEAAFGVLPALLGFSIGAMAITLAFPATAFFRLLAEDGAENSYYLDLASKFLHFIFVQVISIIFLFVVKSYEGRLLNFFGFFLMMYAILTGAATATALFGVAQLYNASARQSISPDPSD
jgi:hypothetical protein